MLWAEPNTKTEELQIGPVADGFSGSIRAEGKFVKLQKSLPATVYESAFGAEWPPNKGRKDG